MRETELDQDQSAPILRQKVNIARSKISTVLRNHKNRFREEEQIFL